ncbi:uncharacterized protein LOC123548699 [Mercenaria mercenaria]|uniref:uncharacterized protein LOC123548699 n=1 Tax=Mercenaria mercenaria TaxID=6596 RepID=UPI00234F2C50|nr:uncharacterized protein LOC123548699 [Mercenaria mercenaria]
MAYAPPPPPPLKRPYPGDWASPRPAKEPRPPGTDDFSGPGGPWGPSYSEYGYYGWGNPDYSENLGYRGSNTSSNNISVDFTDDYSAFYGNDAPKQRGGGNQRGNKAGFGRGQFQTAMKSPQGGMQRGQGHQNRGQFSRGQGNQNRGQGNQNRGQGNQNRGQGNQNRGGNQQNRGGNRGVQRGQFRGRGRGVQRGMPPNVFSNPRGRGRGGNKAAGAVLAVVPPVHTLASAKPDVLDIQNMSMAEKLHRFCLFLRNDDSIKINAIQTIMNAITSSKLGLKAVYESEELAKVAGKAMYTGVLKLDDVFLARAIRPNKKDLKQEVFQKALNVMLSMTVAEIYNLVDPGTEAIREELDRQMKAEEEIKNEGDKDIGSAEAKSLVGGDVKTVLIQLISAIQKMKTIPDSPISVIEQASTQAHILIKHEYQVDITRMKNGRLYCRGKLSIGPVVIGRGAAVTKKQCKTDTYDKTLQRLKTLEIPELLESVPEEPIPDTWMANKSKSSLPLEEKFAELIRCLGTMSFRESNINQIDVAAMQNGIIPMVIFKMDTKKADQSSNIICELYMEKVFITSTEGTSRRECMANVYNTAWEVLTSTSVDTLITQHKQITDEEIKDPALLDVIIKGSGRTVESNTAGLRRFGYQIKDIEDRKLEDLVIMEHSDWSKDRVRNAFCILQFSCNQNGMILQWETDAIKNSYRCVFSVQKQLLGESYGHKKIHARNLAATDALFKLYETQDVIKISTRSDDENRWIPWETITAAADKLRDENIGEEPIIKNDEFGNPLPDAFLMKVLKNKLDEFVKNKEKDELIIGPGIELTEGRELRSYAHSFKLKCDTMQYQGKPYLLIYEKLGWKELVAVLKGRDRPYGKFVLVDKAELPKYEDVMKNIMKDIPKIDEESNTESESTKESEGTKESESIEMETS